MRWNTNAWNWCMKRITEIPPHGNTSSTSYHLAYNLAKAYRSIQKSIANHRVEDWEASNGRTKDTTQLFHSPWHDRVGEHICAQPFRMWNRLRFHPFLQVSQIFQRCKSDANKQDFENKFNLTCQAQSTPKTIWILTKVFCTSGPNLVVLAWTGDEVSHGQAQNGENFDFEGKFDLEGHPPPPPPPPQKKKKKKTIGILTKVFYTSFSNFVILAWTGLELSRGQASDWHTDGQTDAGNDNTQWPYWPRLKTLVTSVPKSTDRAIRTNDGCPISVVNFKKLWWKQTWIFDDFMNAIKKLCIGSLYWQN